jgi:hypothetical protein
MHKRAEGVWRGEGLLESTGEGIESEVLSRRDGSIESEWRRGGWQTSCDRWLFFRKVRVEGGTE